MAHVSAKINCMCVTCDSLFTSRPLPGFHVTHIPKRNLAPYMKYTPEKLPLVASYAQPRKLILTLLGPQSRLGDKLLRI